MLFNSYLFILIYLPVTVAGYFLLAKRSATFAAGWLCLASLFFYGWWDYRYLPLLLGSICFNYWCGLRINAAIGPSRKCWLTGAITANARAIVRIVTDMGAYEQNKQDVINHCLGAGLVNIEQSAGNR